MKEKIYIIIITIICFLSLGCQAHYKLEISEDLIVNEEAKFDYMLPTNSESEDDGIKDILKYELPSVKETAINSNYEIIDLSSDSKVDLTFKRKSSLLNFQSPIFSNIYSYFNTKCTEDKCYISSVADNYDSEGDGIYMDYKISIIVPFKVLKNNADEIDLKSNTYIWYYIVTGKKSNIELVFDRSGKNIVNTNKINSNILTILIIIVIAIVLGFIGRIVYKIVKNSRPD